jgi:RNA polymerase sigma-70 factor (ECF subfamily)
MADTSIPDLLLRLRAGDPQAAEQLFARYVAQLTRLAEEHLSRKLAGRVEGEDVVQSVFRTFFRRCVRGDFQIDGSSQLWRLLVLVTLRKVAARARGLRGEPVLASGLASDGVQLLSEHVASGPGPEDAVILVDEIESLLHGLPALHGRVLELRLAGYDVAEIARQLGVYRQTVYRVLQLLGHRLERAEEKM